MDGAAVQNGNFGPVYFDDAIVYTGCIKSRNSVFYRTYANLVVDQNRTAFGVFYEFGQSSDFGLTFEIDPSETYTCVGFGREKSSGQL